MKRIVGSPCVGEPVGRAREHAAHVGDVRLDAANRSKRFLVWRAMICASEVFPVPGGP